MAEAAVGTVYVDVKPRFDPGLLEVLNLGMRALLVEYTDWLEREEFTFTKDEDLANPGDWEEMSNPAIVDEFLTERAVQRGA